MRVGVIGIDDSEMQQAAARGLSALGHEAVLNHGPVWVSSQADTTFDAVMVCGMQGQMGRAAHFYRRRGTPTVLIDLPHLLRGEVEQWRVTPADLAYLPEGKVRSDRLEALGLALPEKPRKRVKAQSVLLAGQSPDDPTHGMSRGDMEAWASETLESLRKIYDGKVLWRPHPGHYFEIEGFDGYSDSRAEPIEDALSGAWLLVTHSSGAGLDALLAGLPVIATGRPCYRSVSGSLESFGKVAAPSASALKDLFARLAYTQWSEGEISTGKPFEPLLTNEARKG